MRLLLHKNPAKRMTLKNLQSFLACEALWEDSTDHTSTRTDALGYHDDTEEETLGSNGESPDPGMFEIPPDLLELLDDINGEAEGESVEEAWWARIDAWWERYPVVLRE